MVLNDLPSNINRTRIIGMKSLAAVQVRHTALHCPLLASLLRMQRRLPVELALQVLVPLPKQQFLLECEVGGAVGLDVALHWLLSLITVWELEVS